MKTIRPLFVIGLALTLQSCTLTVPLIVFSGSNGLLKGTATGRLDGTGTFQFSSKKLGVECDGDFEYVRRGSKGSGVGTASCSEGTSAEFKFKAATTSKGYGLGEDSRGRPFMFAYGYKESAARKLYEKLVGSKIQIYGDKLMPNPINLPRSTAVGDGKDLKRALARAMPSTVMVTSEMGLGTGFIIRGYKRTGGPMLVMTNNHVVGNNSKVKVKFSNNLTYDGDVIGRSDEIDVALISVKDSPKSLMSLAYCYGNPPQIGESVAAIGNPLGIGTTVTRGIISGLTGTGEQTKVITDAAINKGNSGGPIVNYFGEVIAIATSKIGSIGVDNIAFAIPIDSAFKSLGIRVEQNKSSYSKTECGNISLQ